MDRLFFGGSYQTHFKTKITGPKMTPLPITLIRVMQPESEPQLT